METAMPHRPRTRQPRLRPALPALFALACLALPAGAQAQGGADLGKRLFTGEAAPPCMLCHTLADAEAAGTIGPNLDELKPTESQVRAAVTRGVGVMPAYEDLSEEQVEALAAYVAGAAGR